MPRLRKQLPALTGLGELRFGGFSGSVDYEILGEPSALRLGPLRLRGAFTTTPAIADDAFRAGEAQLTLDGGARFRVTLLGHSTDSGVVYFEMRV